MCIRDRMKDWVMIFRYNDDVTMLPEVPKNKRRRWNLHMFTPLIVFIVRKSLTLL